MTQRGLITNYHPSMSGGTEQNCFLVSSGYFQQDGVVKYSGLRKYVVRLNDELALTKRVKDSVSVNFTRSNSKAILELLRGAALANPIILARPLPVALLHAGYRKSQAAAAHPAGRVPDIQSAAESRLLIRAGTGSAYPAPQSVGLCCAGGLPSGASSNNFIS